MLSRAVCLEPMGLAIILLCKGHYYEIGSEGTYL